MRRAVATHRLAICLLTRVLQQTGRVLSQTQVDSKTNESKAALELLDGLVLKGRVIVGAASLCQLDISQAIFESGGDFLLDVAIQLDATQVDAKNQPILARNPKPPSPARRLFPNRRRSLSGSPAQSDTLRE